MSTNIVLFAAACLVMASCENDSAADLMEPVPTGDITYSGHVKAIIDNNCLACHGAVPASGAPMSLTTYSQVREAVQDRGLLDRISRPEGTPGLMPNGGPRLPEPIIETIIQWNAQGLRE